MKRAIDRLCDAVEHYYQTTPATAAECLQLLTDGLLAIGMEPDCVGLWQVLFTMKEDEEVWDTLSAEEQQNKDLPKGKQRKTVVSTGLSMRPITDFFPRKQT